MGAGGVKRDERMKGLVLHQPGSLTLEDLPIPQPKEGEVLVKVEAATTCGTDLKAYLRGHPQIPMPGVLGHEYSGVVIESGTDAPFVPGQAVMGVHSAPCQNCRWCRRGQENLCQSIMATKVLGSYAEYLLIPARIAALNVFHKPTHLSFPIASLLEPLACVAQGLHECLPRQEDKVLIIGPGAIGLMFAASLKQLGVNDVTLAGRNPSRLGIGERLGAKPEKLTDVKGQYDLVIECTGRVEVWEKSLDYVERGGTLVLFGGCPGGTSASFDTRKVHYDQIKILSPFHFGTEAVRQARQWLLADSFDLSPLLSGVRSLSEAGKVFEDLEHGRGLKYVFQPS